MPADLRPAFEYFVAHQDELVEKYAGKYVAISSDRQILGAYEGAMEAADAAQKKVPLGEFIIQKVSPGTDSFTQTFYSRVSVH